MISACFVANTATYIWGNKNTSGVRAEIKEMLNIR